MRRGKPYSGALKVRCRECDRRWPWYAEAPDESVGYGGGLSPEYDAEVCGCGEPTPTVDEAGEALREDCERAYSDWVDRQIDEAKERRGGRW